MPPRRRLSDKPVRNPSLLPAEIRTALPPWRSTAYETDPVASVRLFLPGTSWNWYVVEFDGDDTCFGLVQGYEVEAGYFSLLELETLYESLSDTGSLEAIAQKGRVVLPVERDESFQPTKLSVLKNPPAMPPVQPCLDL